MVPSLAAYCCAFLLLVEGETTTQYNIAGLLAGFGHGYCFPVLTSQVITRIPASGTSRALALFTAIWELSAITTTGPLGAFADHMGLPAMCGLIVCSSLGLLVCWVFMEHHFVNTPKKLE